MNTANANARGLALAELETPTLCLDLDAYERNVRRMRDYFDTHGVQWRPHMKGQKAVRLARFALDRGAIGVTCATVYEAEAMAEAGITGILIANQTVGARKLARLARLQRITPVISATDSPAHLAMLAQAAQAEGVTIPVLIELNIGMNRSGIDCGAPAVELAHAATQTPGVTLAGLMGWEGHVLKYEPAEKNERIRECLGRLISTAEACRAAGLSIPIVSSSGSGTFLDACPVAGITEVQAGGAVFSDLSYNKWGLTRHEFALTVATRVASRPSPTRIIADGGFKTMSVQHGLPKPLGIEKIQSVVLSAEHGTIELSEPSPTPAVGEMIQWIPGYTDSTLCLHDEMCALRGGIVEEVWVIPGRAGRR
ncbi:MAG: DSD1 family PLP-dependent enzyme [Acidobacteria bacterium]|nr:DSD1 family PLP-dependent enzyme [Acidobacteriota bacterium]